MIFSEFTSNVITRSRAWPVPPFFLMYKFRKQELKVPNKDCLIEYSQHSTFYRMQFFRVKCGFCEPNKFIQIIRGMSFQTTWGSVGLYKHCSIDSAKLYWLVDYTDGCIHIYHSSKPCERAPTPSSSVDYQGCI